MKHGVPEERAFAMDHLERLAWMIVIGQAEGNTWDWSTMAWRPHT